MVITGDLAEHWLGQIPTFPSWPRRRPSTTMPRKLDAMDGQMLAANSNFAWNTIALMLVVDGRLRGQDVIREIWTSQ
jgi:hypothetical protein